MSLPRFIEMRDVTIRNNSNTLTTDSQSLRRNVRERTGQRWELTATLFVLPQNAMAAWAWLSRRRAEAFELDVPGWTDQAGPSVALSQPANIGNTSVSVSSAASVLPGMFCRIGSSSKLYIVESKAGNVLYIYPPVMQAAAAGQLVDCGGDPMTVYIDSQIPAMQQASRRMPSEIVLDLVEALP